jgi:Tfp pilus assembly protein PilN
MSNAGRSRTGLQLIFAFFLGLMVTAFIGVGVYTFHSEPATIDELDERASELRRAQADLRSGRAESELTEAQSQRLEELQTELREVQEERATVSEGWARATTVILVVLSTLVMALSLLRADDLPVINNGLLLGGAFTMLYGMGWMLASGDSQLRFWVVAAALVVTLAMGYVRFVRERKAEATPSDVALASGSGELSRRVDALERRLQAVAGLLGGDERP